MSQAIASPPGFLLPSRHYQTMPSQSALQADLDADNSAHLRRTFILPGGGSPLTITGDLTLHPGQTIRGQSRDRQGPYGTYIVLAATGRIILNEQTCLDTLHVHQDAAASVEGILATETSGQTSAHRFILRDLHMSGGASGVWAILLQNPTEFLLDNLLLITASNGIRIAATNDYSFNPGDAVARKVQVRLQSPNTIGIHLAGQQAITSGGASSTRYPNDIHWFHAYVTAADQGAGYTSAGNTGIKIDNCAKAFFYGVNLEELQTDVTLSGNLGSAISTGVVTGGTSYQVGDVLAFSNAHGGTAAVATVATLSGSAVATLTWTERGSLYQVGDVLTTTGGNGTGAGLTVSTIGGQPTAAVRFFGSWFADAWTINAGVNDAHFDGKFDNEPTGANVANISIAGVRTGLGSSVAQLAMPHIRGPLGGQLLPLETYVTNSSGADIANNRVCYWTAAGTIDIMSSARAAGLFAGVPFGTIANGASGYIACHGITHVASKGAVAVGDYLVVDPANPGFVLSSGTTQSTSQPTIGVALSGGTNATLTMRIAVLPPAPVSSPAASLGGINLAAGNTYSSGLTWTPNTPTLNALYAAPITIANSPTVTAIGLDVSTLSAANGVIRLGIYNDSAGAPGTLLLDAGTLAADGGGTGYKKIAISQALAPGTYWLAAVAQVTITSLVVRAISVPSVTIPYTNFAANAALSGTHNGVQRTTTVSAGLPSPFGAFTSVGGVPRVVIEV